MSDESNFRDHKGISPHDIAALRAQENASWLGDDASEPSPTETGTIQDLEARPAPRTAGEQPLAFGFASPLEALGRSRRTPPWVLRLRDNPFYILAIASDASRIEAERAGQKWLALLKSGQAAAATYQTPFDTLERTEFLVRQALADIADPKKRLYHEFWTQLGDQKFASAPTKRFVLHDFPALHREDDVA